MLQKISPSGALFWKLQQFFGGEGKFTLPPPRIGLILHFQISTSREWNIVAKIVYFCKKKWLKMAKSKDSIRNEIILK